MRLDEAQALVVLIFRPTKTPALVGNSKSVSSAFHCKHVLSSASFGYVYFENVNIRVFVSRHGNVNGIFAD